MNAQTPDLAKDRSALELLLADPEELKARGRELLEQIKAAEAAGAKAEAARLAAVAAERSRDATIARELQLQEVNAKKSARLQEEQAALADKVASHEFNKADDVKRLGEWEQRLKAQADAQATMQAEIDRRVNELASEREKHEADKVHCEAIFAKAQRIKDAMD